MEKAFNDGQKSVNDWIKLHHSDYAAGDIATTLKEGNPSAAAFMKMQAFTTAAVQDQRIRTRIQAALAGNLKRGEDQADFKKVIDSEFDRAGLTRLHPSAIQNIYYTNTSMAFSAGQMQKMVEVSDDFPYWKYSATMDNKTRPDHARLHGKIFRMGDFQFYPPIGFRCRCTAIPLTARQADRFLSSSTPLEGGNRHAIPTTAERENLTNTLANAEFIGNKNEKYLKWLAKEYDKADKETQSYIDKAMDELKREIGENQKEGLKQFFGNEFVQETWDKFKDDPGKTAAANAYKLNTKQAYYINAYTQKAPLYNELNKWLFKEEKPASFTKSQLLTMKRELAASLKKLPKHEGTVYRNIKDLPEEVLKQYQEGKTIVWDGFSSASTEPRHFTKNRYKFKIESKNSRQIGQLSAFPKQKETLFLPGSTFTVLKRQEKGNVIYFTLRED
jgi:SPP1 gp7 family putative phage head morphogenesis protein